MMIEEKVLKRENENIFLKKWNFFFVMQPFLFPFPWKIGDVRLT